MIPVTSVVFLVVLDDDDDDDVDDDDKQQHLTVFREQQYSNAPLSIFVTEASMTRWTIFSLSSSETVPP